MIAALGRKVLKKLGDLESKYQQTLQTLNRHISMKPSAMVSRSVLVGNYTTLFAMTVLCPILLYYRGLDWDLMIGMVVNYMVFWVVVFMMVFGIQVIWFISYFIAHRFGENRLDFEILDKLFGDSQDQEITDFEDDAEDEIEMKRSSG